MLAGANCLLLVNSKCIYCHQKVTEGNLTKIFFIILSICSLIETSSTCWWCGWKRVGRWRRGRTHPWVDKTWWKSEFRQGNWWMTCRRRLIPRQRSSLACTTTAEREREKKKKALDINLVPQADVKTLAAVCFWEEQEEKTGALCGCLFLRDVCAEQ